MAKIVITGASGFVGSHLARKLHHQDFDLVLAGRHADLAERMGLSWPVFVHGDLSGAIDWRPALEDVEILVHTAGYAHGGDESARHLRINLDATLELARQARNAGVKRFIYISSVKVNGEYSQPGLPFSIEDSPRPQSAYAKAKYHAEIALRELVKEGSMDLVILRPCLIYGAGVKANFRQLLRAVECGVPFPFAGIENLRSYLAVDNLVDLITLCFWHPAAANNTFLVSDDEDLSTPQLLRHMANALDVRLRLFRCPIPVLKAGSVIVGQGERLSRLIEFLQVDVKYTRTLLGWKPPLTFEEALRKAVDCSVQS